MKEYAKITKPLSILLSVLMVVSLFTIVPFTAGAAEDHEHNDFAPWPFTDQLPDRGKIYLEKDVTLTGCITVTQTLDICLNGHTITETARCSVFDVNGGTLNLYDEGGGVITGGKSSRGGNVFVENGGKFNMYGGTITGGQAWYGGAVAVKDPANEATPRVSSICTITGGVIVADGSNSDGVGVGIGSENDNVTVSLQWTSPTDSYTMNRISGKVTLVNSFTVPTNGCYPAGEVTDNSVFDNKTLTPAYIILDGYLEGKISVDASLSSEEWGVGEITVTDVKGYQYKLIDSEGREIDYVYMSGCVITELSDAA